MNIRKGSDPSKFEHWLTANHLQCLTIAIHDDTDEILMPYDDVWERKQLLLEYLLVSSTNGYR